MLSVCIVVAPGMVARRWTGARGLGWYRRALRAFDPTSSPSDKKGSSSSDSSDSDLSDSRSDVVLCPSLQKRNTLAVITFSP